MEEIRTELFTAKDMFNSTTAQALKSVAGQTIDVIAVWVTERPDADGVVQPVANFKTADGTIYGTISQAVIRSAVAIPELLKESGTVAIRVESRQGKGNREYLVIQLA